MLGGKGHSNTTKLVKKNVTFMHLQAVGMQKFSDFPSSRALALLVLAPHTNNLLKHSLPNIYRPQRSCSQGRVRARGACVVKWGACMVKGVACVAKEACMGKGVCGGGGHAWQRGRGLYDKGGHAWWTGECALQRGGEHGEGDVHSKGGDACWRGGRMCGRRGGHCNGRYASYWNAFLYS